MIKKIIIGVLLNAAALYGVIYFLPGQIQYTGGPLYFVIGGIIMGVLNSFVKPILKFLTFPVQILTLGLSLIVLNGIIFWIFNVIIDTIQVRGITMEVAHIKTYFLAGFMFGLINWLEHVIIHNK